MARKRPWLAALLAFVYPGMGHAYLRQWLRALLWFGFAVATAIAFIPPDTFQAVEAGGGFAAYSDAVEGLGTDVVLPILIVQACNIVDAYWSALRGNRASARTSSGDDGTRCPHCRRSIDDDLDFCHWCTNPIDTDTTTQ